jgi:alkylation response protein AidB-like acyl-CoA dehydrogenase
MRCSAPRARPGRRSSRCSIAAARRSRPKCWAACRKTFERTVDYLKQREQFGTKIGTFQALQHRAAHMFSEIELLKSVVLDACANVDANPALLPLSASLAKAKANDTFELVSNEAVQMHGGIGTTDELDIGLFLKRSRVAMQILGDARFHRARYATLRGF